MLYQKSSEDTSKSSCASSEEKHAFIKTYLSKCNGPGWYFGEPRHFYFVSSVTSVMTSVAPGAMRTTVFLIWAAIRLKHKNMTHFEHHRTSLQLMNCWVHSDMRHAWDKLIRHVYQCHTFASPKRLILFILSNSLQSSVCTLVSVTLSKHGHLQMLPNIRKLRYIMIYFTIPY